MVPRAARTTAITKCDHARRFVSSAGWRRLHLPATAPDRNHRRHTSSGTGAATATGLIGQRPNRPMATPSRSTARPSPSRRARLRLRPPLPPAPVSPATSSPTEPATRPSISAPRTTPTATVSDLLTAIDLASGVKKAVHVAGGCDVAFERQPDRFFGRRSVTLETSTGADLSITGKADLLKALGLSSSTGAGNATVSVARTSAPPRSARWCRTARR